MTSHAQRNQIFEPLETISSEDISKMSREEIQARLTVLRTHTELLLQQMKQKTENSPSANKNADLYDQLELRHGCGFAQWVIDQLERYESMEESK